MKKFIIAMLCVAVLFGFAACDNSNSDPGTADPTNIAYVEGAVRNAKNYFEGDKPAAADFIFTGYDVEGNVVIADMASALFTGGSVDADKDTVTFTYGSYGSSSVVIEDVPVYEINAIGVETVKTQNYFVNSSIKKIKDDYKVTVYALEDPNDGESAVLASKVLAADEYTIAYTPSGYTDADGNAATKFTKAGDVTLTFTATNGTGAIAYGDPDDNNNTAEISVKQDYITSFTVAQKENSAVEGATINTDASTYVEVTYTMASGTVDKTSGTFKAAFVTAIGSGAKFSSDETYTVKVTATVNGKEESDELKLVLVKNALVSFEVEYSGSIKNGTTIALEDISVKTGTLKWLDQANAPAGITEAWLTDYLVMSVDGSSVEEYKVENFGDGQKLPLTFSLSDASGYASAECKTVLTVAGSAAVDTEFDWSATSLTLTGTDWSSDKSGELDVYAPGDLNGTELKETTDYTVSVADAGSGSYTVTVNGVASTAYEGFSVEITVSSSGLTATSED